MTILISAANSDISDSLCRIHKEFFPNERVIGVAPDGLWPASAIFDMVYKIGYVNESNYLSSILDIIEKEDISIFIPVSEHELRFILSKDIQWPDKVRVLMNPPEVLTNCLDKQRTADWLNKIGVNCPKTLHLDRVKKEDLPVFIKGRASAGSKNTYVVHTWDLYTGLLKEFEQMDIAKDQMVAQHYISNTQEYTCAIARINDITNYIVLRRELAGGITVRATVSYHKNIMLMLEKIATNINGNFFVNVQLRLENNIPTIFEINPRFSSTVMLRHMVGFQDFIWHMEWLKQAKRPPLIEKFNYENMYRVFREVVV